MAKFTSQAAGHAARKQAQRPSKGTTTKADPAKLQAALEQAQAAAPVQVSAALQQAAAVLQAAAPASAPATIPRAVAAVPDCPPIPGQHGKVPLDKLPKSIAAKGTNTGVCPTDIADVVFYPGKPFTARSPHNAQWAELAIKVAASGATGKALAQAGVPVHSIKAYIKRQWLVRTAPVKAAA